MLLPLIGKDIAANDFTCRDGEIEGIWQVEDGKLLPLGSRKEYRSATAQLSLTPVGTYPTANIRIALESGEKEKANLLLTGEISRVDPKTADRLTQAIIQKAAETLLDLSTDLRRQGLFILPFRFYTMTMTPDGTLSFPTPQAVALPTDYPPHPEITAFTITEDALTLALRFPVRPHRLKITPSDSFPEDHSLRLFISYPLYIPDPKEMRGSIGGVRSATGGNAVGIRFSFLSMSSVKASVAAPEKYYEMVGNERTGYRLSSKVASSPDYSCFADIYGYMAASPRESMLALGDGVEILTDPADWIADWEKSGAGYFPISLPPKFRDATVDEGLPSSDEMTFPEGVDVEEIIAIAATLGMTWILLTRPMAFASDSRSRRNVEPGAIRSIRIHGLSESPSYALLYGSNDCRHWEVLRRFDARRRSLVLSPPRFWWRLLIFSQASFGDLALECS